MIGNSLRQRLYHIFSKEEMAESERTAFIRLVQLFIELPNPDIDDLFPDYAILKTCLQDAIDDGNAETIEEAFLNLYCHVHGYEAPYSKEERKRVRETGGYWCHAGGLSPIIKAGKFIHRDTISSDFGAGNGLQCLLMQKLYPHRKTIQIEICEKMVDIGRHLQAWLQIPKNRVEWIVADVLDVLPYNMDFIYLYRPVRPQGEGERFYKQFASCLAQSPKQVVIFSIADCLRQFLQPQFKILYFDGHLTCYQK